MISLLQRKSLGGCLALPRSASVLIRRRRVRRLFFPTRTASSSSSSSSSATQGVADIIAGPSLLRTTASQKNRPRPSLLHLPGLRALPFWTQVNPQNQETSVAYKDRDLTAAVQHLESHAHQIYLEYQANSPNISSDYQTDTEHSLHHGTWDWHSYMRKGKLESPFAERFPNTTKALDELRKDNILFEGTPFGYAFFSTLHAQSKIDAHTAPMNFRLRIHLGLSIPSTDCGIRVGSIERQWNENKALVLDDSYEHETWNHHSSQARVLLLVDIWHPDVTPSERQEIVAMFQEAQAKGWLSQ